MSYNDLGDGSALSIPGFDTAAGIRSNGSEEHYIKLLGDVYELIDKKCDDIEGYISSGNITAFTTGVHALKTTCRMMGQSELSERFLALEMLGKENRADEAFLKASPVLEDFRALKPLLEPFAAKPVTERVPLPVDELINLLSGIRAAVADFDVSAAEAAAGRLLTCECDEELYEEFKKLAGLVSDLDYDEASVLADSLAAHIKNAF